MIKKLVDCPSCGAKGTMKYKKDISETFRHITIYNLNGLFCSICNEGFFSEKSTKKISKALKICNGV